MSEFVARKEVAEIPEEVWAAANDHDGSQRLVPMEQHRAPAVRIVSGGLPGLGKRK